jgi:uncharacterized protein (DUF736 family)
MRRLLLANSEKRTEYSPDYFIKAGDRDRGVGWRSKAKGKAGKPYVRVILDDPGFPAPVDAVLLGLNGAASLVWKRIRTDGSPPAKQLSDWDELVAQSRGDSR